MPRPNWAKIAQAKRKAEEDEVKKMWEAQGGFAKTQELLAAKRKPSISIDDLPAEWR